MALILKKKKKGDDEHHDEHPQSHDEGHGGAAHDEEGWLVSYADMMTLLCGFFIMLFSMATMDEPKFEKVKEAVAKEFGGTYVSPTADLAELVTRVLQEAGVAGETTVRSDPMGVSITFHATIFFDTLSSDLRERGHEVIKKVSGALAEYEKKSQKQYKVVVEGHTDSRPILSGPYPSNWELSASRASHVVRLFLEQGFRAQQMTAIGYADTYPEKPERKEDGSFDETALSQNRRVVVRILQPKVDHIPLPTSASDAEVKTAEQTTLHEAPPVVPSIPAAANSPTPPAPNTVAPATTTPVPQASAPAVPAPSH